MNSSTKAQPMPKDETMLLVKLVAANKIINNKATNATNNRLKDQAWETLTNDFNSLGTSFPRTPSQLRLKWENLTKSARKRCAKISTHNKTGGGKDYIPPDEVLDKVASLLGSNCQGFSMEFGGDTTKNTNLNSVIGDIEINIEAKRKHKLEEENCKARIFRENALAEYLIAKKKKIDLENEEKEILIAKLKLELDNARLENLKLKTDLNNLQFKADLSAVINE